MNHMNESVVSRNELEQIMPKIHPVSVRTSWLKDDDCRMDAYYYNAEAISVLKSIIGGELDTKKLGDPEVTKPYSICHVSNGSILMIELKGIHT